MNTQHTQAPVKVNFERLKRFAITKDNGYFYFTMSGKTRENEHRNNNTNIVKKQRMEPPQPRIYIRIIFNQCEVYL